MTAIQRSINDGEAPARGTCTSELTVPQLRKMAWHLRKCARMSRWPDFAERLIRAAESLEVQAVEMEAGFSMTPADKAALPIYY